jgi:TonB family protein
MTVEYDTASTDHLYISEFRKNGSLKTKTQLLFKGQKFNLDKLEEYNLRKELLVDGIKTEYNEDETIASEFLFKEKTLIGQSLFYPDGKKQLSFECIGNMKSGLYNFWYPSGQLNLSGSYFNNQKEGEFKLFDESGNLLRTGVYQKGKLISGDAVVENVIFEKPEISARFQGGQEAFNQYLISKTANLECVKQIPSGESFIIDADLTIAETGKLISINVTSRPNALDNEVLSTAFAEFPGFIPASVENIPVKSIKSINFLVLNEGLQQFWETTNPISKDTLAPVEVLPVFPGGRPALLEFVMKNIKYPVEAQQLGIKGKVMIRFIIEKDGSISNIQVFDSKHPSITKACIDVIKLLPKWRPGMINGEPARAEYTIPLTFSLQ